MNARYILSRLLLLAMVAMAIYAVSHIHGISDPDQPHTIADGYLQQQAQSGLMTEPILPILAPLHSYSLTTGWAAALIVQHRILTNASRAPPKASSTI